jgi:hypothetical protein
MTEKLPDSINFKMRRGKQIEAAFGCVFCLILCAPFIWMLSVPEGGWSLLTLLLFMIIFIGAPLFGSITFATSIIRSRLTFSSEGIYYQGPFLSTRAPWEEVKGFISSSGEQHLQIEKFRNQKKVKSSIPISLFTKIRNDNKPHKADSLMISLHNFAPHIFETGPFEETTVKIK